jgi:hypothetical protein
MWLLIRWALARDATRMAMFAAFRGWEFRREDPAMVRRFDCFPFGPGIGGQALNVLTGPHRFRDCATFTYVVAKPAPQMYQVSLVEIGARVPRVELFPGDLVATLVKAMGGQDIETGDPTFDDAWRIVSDDERFVRSVLGPELRRRLSRRDTRGMPIAIEAGAVLTWQAGPVGIRRISRRLDALIEVVDAIPEDAWKAGLA